MPKECYSKSFFINNKIQNFREEAAINTILSILHDNDGSVFYNPTFNPIDKVVELHERMLKEKDELIGS